MTYDLTTTAGRIRWAMNEAGIAGAAELARMLGKRGDGGRVVVARWLAGEGISDASLREVAQATGVSYEWLRVGGQQPGVADVVTPAAANGNLLAELRRVEGLPIDEWRKDLRAEQLLAAHRQIIAQDWAHTEREKARAMRLAELNALARERRFRRAEDGRADRRGEARQRGRKPPPDEGASKPAQEKG